MKLVWSALVLAIATFPMLSAKAKTPSAVFAQVSPSVVVVLNVDWTGKPLALGSGVVIPQHINSSTLPLSKSDKKSSGVLVATNCHVVVGNSDPDDFSFTSRYTSNKVRYREHEYNASLVSEDLDRDICTLYVPNLHAPAVTFGSASGLKIGTTVYAVGSPEGLELSMSDGIVSGLRDANSGHYIQTTAAISHGSSGGGLFDNRGHLLGLTSFYIKGGEQLNFALPVEWIEELPQRDALQRAWKSHEGRAQFSAIEHEDRKAATTLVLSAAQTVKSNPDSLVAWKELEETESFAEGFVAKPSREMVNDEIASAQQEVRLGPQYAFTWEDLGKAYGYEGSHMYSEQIEAFRHSLEISSEDPNIWSYLGDAYDGAGRYSLAIDAYKHALQTVSLEWAKIPADGKSSAQDIICTYQRSLIAEYVQGRPNITLRREHRMVAKALQAYDSAKALGETRCFTSEAKAALHELAQETGQPF